MPNIRVVTAIVLLHAALMWLVTGPTLRTPPVRLAEGTTVQIELSPAARLPEKTTAATRPARPVAVAVAVAQTAPPSTPFLPPATASPTAATPATPAAESTAAEPDAPAAQGAQAAPIAAPTAPRFDAAYLQNPAPVYPPLSRRAGEEGKVVLQVFVEASGLASTVKVQESAGVERLDQAAIAAVKRWKFIPAQRGTEAVGAWVRVPIVFSLKG